MVLSHLVETTVLKHKVTIHQHLAILQSQLEQHHLLQDMEQPQAEINLTQKGTAHKQLVLLRMPKVNQLTLAETDRTLRHTLTMLIEWIESGDRERKVA